MAINIGLVHVGQAIEEVLRLKQITQAQFAEMLNKTQPTVNALLKKSSIDTERLKVISLILDYNFFEDFCPDLKKKREEQIAHGVTESESETVKELVRQMSYLRDENIRKDKEIGKLLAVIDTFTSIKNKEESDSKKIANV
jgi:transcriptional regulator with XRE-family HTH domain